MTRRFVFGPFSMAWMGVVLCFAAGRLSAQQVEPPMDAKWYVSASAGQIQYEGDEPVDDAFQATIRLGYDYSEWWTFETSLDIVPQLDETIRYDIYQEKDISRLEEIPGNEGVHDSSAFSLAIDALFHFTRWERLDPYLTLGAGFTQYEHDMGDGKTDPALRVGGGVMYHFNDEWALRADARTFVAGADTEANMSLDAGFVWTWGARVAPNFVATGSLLDSDGDGLTDEEEEGTYHTDPYDPDTDKDELTDGQEVKVYDTDPLNPDTDLDALKDGAEVLRHKTNPKDRDTDDGGVADGHEVIEDSTNPLDPSDDLVLFELYIEFDYDKSIIKPVYFKDLDVIAKVLKRNPEASARIEGHADRNRKSKDGYNKKLSLRRAQAVLDYLADQSGIDRQRMTAHGYGFDRPKEPNDPQVGNPRNRRVEVYIRGAEGERKLTTK